MNRKTALILIILIATTIPGAWGETETASITESEDDVWMTEAGNVFGYESSVHILDGSIGLRAFLRFEDVAIAKSDKIDLATLFVYAGFDQGASPDPGASVTIYGIAEPDCSPFSYSGRVWSLERPMTSASVNWNLSTWPYGWNSVNVTDIVKEIVNRYAWEENNSLGLQILGASDSGQEVRTFEDIDHQYHGAYAYLYIQYNLPPGVPPGLPSGATFVETYQDWDIWSFLVLDYENFYEDWTETDPNNLLVCEESSPYRIVFDDFGYENYWDDKTHFRRDENLNASADTIEFRFKAHLSDEDTGGYNRPDFHWVALKDGSYYCSGAHYVGPATTDDHYYSYQTDAGSHSTSGGMFMADPIPPVKTQWYSMKFNYSGDNMRIAQFLTEPANNSVWDYGSEKNYTAGGVHIEARHYVQSYVLDSRLGSDFYLGWSDGYIENLRILVDGVDAYGNETNYVIIDENGTVIDTWTDNPDGENFTDIEDLKDWVDDVVNPQGGDPLDPAPGAGWEETGPFTRFRMRLYFLMIGVACIFVPIWAISYKRPGPQGVAWCCMLILIGLGLLISIPNI